MHTSLKDEFCKLDMIESTLLVLLTVNFLLKIQIFSRIIKKARLFMYVKRLVTKLKVVRGFIKHSYLKDIKLILKIILIVSKSYTFFRYQFCFLYF